MLAMNYRGNTTSPKKNRLMRKLGELILWEGAFFGDWWSEVGGWGSVVADL